MFRIKLKGENEWFDLPEGSVIPLRYKNPYFLDDATLQTPFSYPFTLARYPKLWQKLQHPDRPEVVSKNKRQFDVDVLVAECLKLSPKMQILSADRKTAEVNVYTDPFTQKPEFKDKSIREFFGFTSEDIVPEPDVYFDFLIEGTPVTSTFIFTYGEDLIYNLDVLSSNTIDDVINNLALLINADTGDQGLDCENIGGGIMRIHDTTLWSKSNGIILTGKLQYPGASGAGAGLAGGILGEPLPTQWLEEYHDDLRAAMKVLAETDSYDETTHFNFFTNHNDLFYGENNVNPDYLKYVNLYEALNDRFMLNIDGDTPFSGNKYTVVPYVYVRYVWDKIFEAFGINVEMERRQGFEQLTFWNTYSLDKYYFSQINPDDGIVCFNNYVEFRKHLPEMTISEFLEGLKSLFNWAYMYDENARVVKVEWRNEIRKTTQKHSLNGFPFRTGLDVEYHYGNGFTFKSNLDSNDKYAGIFAVQDDEYIVGEGEKEHLSIFSWPSTEMMMQLATLNPNFSWKVPATKQTGTSEAFDIYSEFSPRLIFYRGFDLDLQGTYQYPYASNDSYDSRHTIYEGSTGENTYDMTLIWSKMYPAYWQKWIQITEHMAEMEVEFIMPVAKLMAFAWADELLIGESYWYLDEWELIGTMDNKAIINMKCLRSLTTTIN
jgi:hypothetical protein